MPERLLLGGGDYDDVAYVYFADGDATGRTEGTLKMRLRTKAIAPAGPTGEAVFRRAYVTVSSHAGYQVRVTPILDGVELYDCAMVFADRIMQPTGSPITHVLEVPIMYHDPERDISYGARGTSLELLIETEPVVLAVDGGHTYWRVLGTEANNVSAGMSLVEVKFRAVSGGEQLATGGTAIADSNLGAGYEESRAFDGLTSGGAGTYWHSANTAWPHWVGYQFSQAVTVTEVAISPRTDANNNRAPKDFSIQYSDDGSTWVTQYQVNDFTTAMWGTSEKTWSVPAESEVEYRQGLLGTVNIETVSVMYQPGSAGV